MNTDDFIYMAAQTGLDVEIDHRDGNTYHGTVQSADDDKLTLIQPIIINLSDVVEARWAFLEKRA